MERRTLLAGAGAAFFSSLGGCLDDPIDGGADTGADDAVAPSPSTASTAVDDCGPGDRPLSALLADRTGDPGPCFDGARPSFAIENERDEALTVAVDLAGGDSFAETYALDPGDRVVERGAFEVGPEITGTVRVGDAEERTVEWPERSCYRHGIALAPDGIEIGWVEPLQGPGDTQHDCYPGDDVPLKLWSEGDARTITVTIVDSCAETTFRETFELPPDESERIDGELASGGTYEITVDVEDGESETYEFFEGCWGVDAVVEEDGGVRMNEFLID